MSTANVTLVQNLYAAFGRGEIATVVGAITSDASWHVHGRPTDHPSMGEFKGPAGVQKFFDTLAEVQTASVFSPREFDGCGDKVFVRGHYVWTIKKSGKTVDTEWLHIFTVKDGKVAAFDEFTDTAQFAEAMRG